MSTVVVELYEALRQAGVDDALARGAASAVVPANALGDLATKHDFAELRLATKHDFAELRLATKHDFTELRLTTKRDLAEFRLEWKSEVAELKAELIKWNVGTMIALTALCAAIVRLG